MLDVTDHAIPVATANEVVTAEVKVAQNHADTLSPDARKLAEEMYKNLTMGCDSYLHMLPRVEDNRIKTDASVPGLHIEASPVLPPSEQKYL